MDQIKNVLLIDDEHLFNFINKEIIKMETFAGTVNSHMNAKKALQELKTLSECGSLGFPEVIFLDINMPVMDGWEFLQEFEKLPEPVISKCKVYILSSSIDPSDVEKSKSYKSVKDFFSKPLTPKILESISLASVAV